MTACLLYAVNEVDGITLTTIDHKFLETGHTYMEVDSMHAACEYAKKNTNIFVPSQWDTVLQMARRTNPYFVVPLKYWYFKDFKKLVKEYYNGTFKKDTSGKRINWLDIKWIRVKQNDPDTIYFKYSFSDTEFKSMKVKKNTRVDKKQLSI